ncbi:MAG: YraN family protein [Sediminibacterium sp.]
MATHIETVKQGEDLSVDRLKQQDFVILQRNWKSGRTELDVIAEKNSELHIIEIKTRTTDTYGFPEERITKNKLQRISIAAENYLTNHPQFKEYIIDVLSVKINSNTAHEFFLIEDIRP